MKHPLISLAVCVLGAAPAVAQTRAEVRDLLAYSQLLEQKLDVVTRQVNYLSRSERRLKEEIAELKRKLDEFNLRHTPQNHYDRGQSHHKRSRSLEFLQQQVGILTRQVNTLTQSERYLKAEIDTLRRDLEGQRPKTDLAEWQRGRDASKTRPTTKGGSHQGQRGEQRLHPVGTITLELGVVARIEGGSADGLPTSGELHVYRAGTHEYRGRVRIFKALKRYLCVYCREGQLRKGDYVSLTRPSGR